MKPNHRRLQSVVMVAALLVLARTASADSVGLSNGDKLTGKVVGLSNGKLKLETEHSGTVDIKWDKIAALQTMNPFRVRATDGAVVEGKLSLKDGKLSVQETQETPATVLEPKAVDLINPPDAPRWSGRITLAYTAEDGNSNSTDIFGSVEIIRETEQDKFLLRGHAKYGTEKSQLTDQAGYGKLQYDLRMSQDYFLYASTEARTDKFEDLTVRGVASIGAGYVLIRGDALDLWFDAGPTYVYERVSTGVDECWMGARATIHLKVILPLGLELTDDATFYPNFKESTNWQLHNEGSISTSIGAHWSLNFGIITDFDHKPLPGNVNHDDTYVVGLRYKF